jgi:hypothetical protein
MNDRKLSGSTTANFAIALACIALSGPSGPLVTCVSAQIPTNDQAATANLPAGVQDVVQLTKAGIGEDPILAKIKKANISYDLTTDQIISLKNLGVSENVITALIGSSAAPQPAASPAPVVPPAPVAKANSTPAATPPPVPTEPPPAPPAEAAPAPASPEVNFNYFHDQLAPYGQWVDVPGYGACWYPTQVIAANPDWRPYYDMGHWVNTDNGLFWASDYNWGDIPFHYGRWIKTPEYPWLWVPDYTWGPAWVAWRHAEADGYIGWAPLPFGAVWVDGGFRFHDRLITEVGFDFGLGEDYFAFVANDHFLDDRFFRLRGRYAAFEVRRDRIHEFYGRSVFRNEFRRDEHGRFVNGGIGRDRIERATGRRLETARFEERHPAVRQEKPEMGGRPGEQGHPAGGAAQKAPAVNKVFRPPAAAPAKAAAAPASPKKK